MSTVTIWQQHFGDVAAVNLADKRVEAFFEALNQECLAEDATMRFWKHNNNGRVGKYPTQPNENWFEISRETFERDVLFQ